MIHDATVQRLASGLHQADPSAVCVVKRLWDETSMRIQLTEADLHKVVGSQADQVAEVKHRSRGGRGSVFPGFTIQSFQQMCFVRWGKDSESAGEVVLPTKLLVSNTADSIWAGLSSSMPPLSPAELRNISERVRLLVLYSFPDGFPGNVVAMQHQSQEVPLACCFDAHCSSHLLQLVWDSGARKILANPLYQLTQIMANSQHAARVGGAWESLAVETDITIGVEVSERDRDFNKVVLDQTVRRPLLTQSFFTAPGGSRHDASSYATMQEQLNVTCAEIQSGLTSPWFLPRVSHTCFGELPGNRCCDTMLTARTRTRASLRALNRYCLGSLNQLASNKWRSISECLAKITPGVLIHGSLSKAFTQTLATNTELARLGALVAGHDEQVAAADAGAVQHDDPQAFRVLRGKRILGAAEFLQHPDTAFSLLAFLVASQPIDKLFSTFFEAEEFARREGGDRAEGRRGKVGLLQSMVAEDGILHQVHCMLAQPVCQADSPIYLMLRLVPDDTARTLKGMRLSRGMQLRLSASFNHRFLGLFWNEQYTHLRILNEGEEARRHRLTKFMAPVEHQTCRKCEGQFLQQVRARLAAPPALSVDEQVQVTVEAYGSIAEDPLVVSMHLVEALHSSTRQAAARSMDRRKKLPVT
jgi:hypothetical protein